MGAEWWTSWGNWLVRNKKRNPLIRIMVSVSVVRVCFCVYASIPASACVQLWTRGPHWVSSLSLSTLIFWDRVSHQIWASCSESPWCTPFSTPLPALGWQVDRCAPPPPAFTWTSKNQPQGLALAQQTLYPPEPPSCSCSGTLTVTSNTIPDEA